MIPALARILPGLCLAALLAACAVAPPQATVQVFTLPVRLAPGTAFRQDVLPSQAQRPDQPALQAVADAALVRAGLRRDDANARLAVQVSVSQDAVAYGPVAGPPWVNVGVGGGSWGGGGVGVGLSFPIGGGGVGPAQRVDVVLRDLATGQVVFQAQASGAGWSAPALLEAALRGFPGTPPGIWTVPPPAGR
jgi:hypothetical protein